MTTFTQQPWSLEALVTEAPGYISRDPGTIASGSGLVKAGTVLGKVLVATPTSAIKAGGNTGNGTVGSLSLQATGNTKVGVYQVRFTAATVFTVTNPDGNNLVGGTTGVAYADGIGFTITAGGTAFVAGDGFDVTVAAGSGKYVPNTTTAADGSQKAAAVSLFQVDATSVDVATAVLARTAEVSAPQITRDASISSPTLISAQNAQLAAVGIMVR